MGLPTECIGRGVEQAVAVENSMLSGDLSPPPHNKMLHIQSWENAVFSLKNLCIYLYVYGMWVPATLFNNEMNILKEPDN